MSNFFDKLKAGVKEGFRKFLVSLKKNPNAIPLVVFIIAFLVFSLNLTAISNTTATIQGKGMGLCEFASMLFSILSFVCLLNAFPKRQKPNWGMLAVFFGLYIIITVADIIYITRISEAFAKLGDILNKNPEQKAEYLFTQQVMTIHVILMQVTAVTVALEPVFAKLLKKINTSIEIEKTNVGEIELADEE